MKTIGLIGGMSWQSSAHYYRLINEETARRLGGHHNAPSIMVTVDFAEVEQRQRAGEWAELGELMAGAARKLEAAGADLIVLCTNTMHKVSDAITSDVRIPMLHIADETAAAIRRAGQKKVGLLGTRFTMEDPFYADRIRRAGIDVVTPNAESRQIVHNIIYGELCHGLIRAESLNQYQQIIAELASQGAESVILGCTEIGLLVSEKDSPLPVHDSTIIHALAAVTFALS